LHDERDAGNIRDELRRYGLDVWWDAELPPGKKWAREVSRALERSDAMIVLVSPQAMASDLVRRELEYAITNVNFQSRLFPVIIRPTTALPGYFALLPLFDVTEDRTRGLKKVARAISARDR
jgi:hypothetical protein